MEEFIIETENLSCKVGYRYLLQDITWKVRKGERWVVFGMNGCGKTTLLSIIAGFKHYTSGDMKLFGEPIDNDNILRMRQRIGWVSSSFFDKYYTKESAMDIVLSGKFGTLGLGSGITLEDTKRADGLLRELHLADRMNHTFDMLSKGERQNVLIARALFSKPDILVFDEPCTALDIYNREYFFQALEDIVERDKVTIIYVTHYAEEITDIFDQCLLLKNGHLFAQGPTKTLFCDDTISRLLDHPVTVLKNQGKGMTINVKDVKANIAQFL